MPLAWCSQLQSSGSGIKQRWHNFGDDDNGGDNDGEGSSGDDGEVSGDIDDINNEDIGYDNGDGDNS